MLRSLTLGHWSVANIIRNGCWYLRDVEHLLPSYILTMIKATPLSKIYDMEDFITWDLSKSGIFTIKSAYHLVKGNSSSHQQNQWKVLWNAPIHNRLKLLG